MIDRVELVLVDEPLEMRKLERDHTVRRQKMRHPCGEVVEIGDLRQHIVADDEIGPPALETTSVCASFRPKNSTSVGIFLLLRHFGHVGGRFDAESRARPAAGSAEADIRRCWRSRTPGSSRQDPSRALIISQ